MQGFGGRFEELLHACTLKKKSRDQFACTSSTLYARISPLWLSWSWDKCGQLFLDELHIHELVSLVSRCGTLCVCLDSTVSQLRLCWVKGICVFRFNLPPALWAEWTESFTCPLRYYMGVERTPNSYESAQKNNSGEEKFSRLSCRGSNPQGQRLQNGGRCDEQPEALEGHGLSTVLQSVLGVYCKGA